MVKYFYKDHWYTPNQLSELSGIEAHTIRDRLRRGFPVEEAIKPVPTLESIREFSEASYYQDWIGMPISDLHEIYWKWCIQHGYSPIGRQGFSRQLLSMYPMLKTIPTKQGDKCHRVIRLRG